MADKSLDDRLWSRVDITNTETGCWLWRGGKDRHGYGVVCMPGGRRSRPKRGAAHRVAGELSFGTIPDGMCVCHSCDVRACVNPCHLFLGAVGDNNRDMVAKGRGGYQPGTKHARAKMNDDLVRLARGRRSAGVSVRAIAIDYGVTPATVRAAVNGTTWRHVQ